MIGVFKIFTTLMICGSLAVAPPAGGNPAAMPAVSTPVQIPVSTAGLPGESEVLVHFLDVGQADAIYIQLPDNEDVLIDAGDVGDGPLVVDYLREQELDGEIELLIATHPHRDHIGGIPAVLEAFAVREVLDSGLVVDTKIYRTYAESVVAEQCTWSADDYQVYQFGECQLAILTGAEEWGTVNNYSVVARLDCGEVEFLFMGDAEEEVEEMLAGDISAKILKVGHHGSASSTSAEFLARVQPDLAVISVGGGNRYGHPDEEVLGRLAGTGIAILRTDIEGNSVIIAEQE